MSGLREAQSARTVDRALRVPAALARLRELGLEGLVDRAAKTRAATPEEVVGPRKTKRVVAARRVAILALSGYRAELSTTDLGELLGGRDHTTIVHLRKRATESERQDARALVEELSVAVASVRLEEPSGRSPW